jgi:hypothetical protein
MVVDANVEVTSIVVTPSVAVTAAVTVTCPA